MPDLTLKVKVKDGYLDVDQAGNANQMGQGQSGTITWRLVDTAASGTFNSQDDSNPGFAWKTDLDTSAFGPPYPDGKTITMEDSNDSSNSAGSYRYQLYATISGQQYSTNLTDPTETTTNPMIINK